MDVEAEQGDVFALYFFQMSFATTATTIVSGAMAERTHLNAYTIYSFTNTITYVFPAHWLWGEKGFLKELGVIDVAGKKKNKKEKCEHCLTASTTVDSKRLRETLCRVVQKSNSGLAQILSGFLFRSQLKPQHKVGNAKLFY